MMPIPMPAFPPVLSGCTDEVGSGARSKDDAWVACAGADVSSSANTEVGIGRDESVTYTVIDVVIVSLEVVRGKTEGGIDVGSGAKKEDKLSVIGLLGGNT
jgi:hypothetical protein